MRRNPIFRNPETQKKFDKQGFVVIPFVSGEQLRKLDLLFNELHPELPENGFVASSYSPDKEYKQKVSNGIVEILRDSYERAFVDYQPFGASYLFKMPSSDSALAVHQDWTIVDEAKYYALNCWIPMCDITTENGPLMVLPGSHFDHFHTIRAPTAEFFFSGDEEKVMNALVPLEMKVGSAVILNQSLIHYSPPNRSGKIRKAITAGVKSKGAPMCFYYKAKEGEQKDQYEKFEMPEDFLISFENFGKDIFSRPKGRYIESVSYKIQQKQGAGLDALIGTFRAKSGFRKKNATGFRKLGQRLKALLANV